MGAQDGCFGNVPHAQMFKMLNSSHFLKRYSSNTVSPAGPGGSYHQPAMPLGRRRS